MLSTGKQIRYGHAIAQRFRKLGHRCVLTTREHPDTTNIMKSLGERFELVGRYDPTSLATRFKASIERELKFFDMFNNDTPQVAVSHGSVELCRTAFGLGMHLICTGDTPYAQANWLIIPLTDTLVISRAIPTRVYRKFGAKKIAQFDGVDEVAWVRPFRKGKTGEYRHPLIVVRQSEFRASYMKGSDLMLDIARKLTRLGSVLFLSRYNRDKTAGLTVPKKFVDSLAIAGEADLVVGVGGTIAREAALQGTPSLVVPVLGWTYVNEYIRRKGFPLYKANLEEMMKVAKTQIGRKMDVRKNLADLENPVDVIEKLVQTQAKIFDNCQKNSMSSQK